MKTLTEYITEAAAPKFSNDRMGIEAFCEYVFSNEMQRTNGQVSYTVNDDLSITVTPDRSGYVALNTQDLKEIPEFIVFSGMEASGLGFYDSKMTNLKLNVNGYIRKLIINDKKLVDVDLSNCMMKASKGIEAVLNVENCTKLKSLVGPNRSEAMVRIRKNANLESIDLSGVKFFSNGAGSFINKNKKLVSNNAKLPKDVGTAVIEMN